MLINIDAFENNLLKNVIEAGATSFGKYCTPKRDYIVGEGWGIRLQVFNIHYFNAQGLEVAYYIPMMGVLNVLDTPRQWADCFKRELQQGDIPLTFCKN